MWRGETKGRERMEAYVNARKISTCNKAYRFLRDEDVDFEIGKFFKPDPPPFTAHHFLIRLGANAQNGKRFSDGKCDFIG